MNGAYMYVGGEDCDTMVMREERVPLLDGGCVECVALAGMYRMRWLLLLVCTCLMRGL